MRNKGKKHNLLMREKVTIKQFLIMQIKILHELYKKNKLYTAGMILLSCITMCTSFIELKLLEYVTNSVSSFIRGNSNKKFHEFGIYIGLFLSTLLIMRLISNVYNIISEKYQSKIVFETETKIVNKLSNLSYEYYEANAFHEKIKLASQASGQYSNAINGVTQIIRIIIMFIVYGVMLSRINILFIGVIFLSIGISTVVAMNVTDKQLDYWRTHVSPETRRNLYFKEILGSRINHQNIQTTRSYLYFGKKYKYYNNRERINYLKLNILSFITEISTSLMFMIVFLVTVIDVGKGVVSGQYEIGYYSMVIALLTNLFSVIKQFTLFIMNNNWYIKVLDAYYEIMSLDEDHAVSIDKSECTIEINNLKYRYPQTRDNVLNGIDISFRMGEKIAVIGYNGSGKTTLISVILGLLKNYEGSFTHNLIKCSAVLQDFGQYQMSIKENIEIGCGGKKLEEDTVNDILKEVGLYDFISTKEEGIHTKLGQLEKGVELSKGQWQRLAIGRLLADEDANVWILDEPTAYLDPIAEIEMYKLIFNIAKNRLVFFISHRLGFAKNADRIIVVHNGEIVEDGTHKELRESNGLYSQMFDVQRTWYE